MGDETGEAGARPSAGGAPGDEPTANSQEPTAGDQPTPEELAETYYKNWQRATADFINYKRRVEQERSETARLYNAALVINLLPLLR